MNLVPKVGDSVIGQVNGKKEYGKVINVANNKVMIKFANVYKTVELKQNIDASKKAEESHEGLNGYVAFYKGKQTEVWAKTSYEAQKKAAEFFKAKKSYEVTVALAEKADGSEVVHTPVDASKKVATGEMSQSDIEEGGEHYGWAQAIEGIVEQLVVLTNGKVVFEEMRPFDVYQGPYALVRINGKMDKIWDGYYGEDSLIDDIFVEKLKLNGDVNYVASIINGDKPTGKTDSGEADASDDTLGFAASKKEAGYSTMNTTQERFKKLLHAGRYELASASTEAMFQNPEKFVGNMEVFEMSDHEPAKLFASTSNRDEWMEFEQPSKMAKLKKKAEVVEQYISYSSMFNTKPFYKADAMLKVLQDAGIEGLRKERIGGDNQPEVVVFEGDEMEVKDILREAANKGVEGIHPLLKKYTPLIREVEMDSKVNLEFKQEPTVPQECERCNGVGWDVNNNDECPECNGEGKI